MEKYIDLHTHSTASDGTVSPDNLIKMASDVGLHTMALTDHDTVSGVSCARQTAKEYGIELIAGCELASSYPGGELHILGLWVPDQSKDFLSFLQKEHSKRYIRNEQILKRLSAMGIKLSSTFIESDESSGHAIGRPHIARALIEEGYVRTIKEAFEKYLGSRGSAYVPRTLLMPEECVETLATFGATVFIAHPRLSSTMTANKLDSLIKRLKPKGLSGLEVYHSSHGEEDVNICSLLVEKHKLIASGGSDFHGETKPNTTLGRVKNNEKVPYSLLEKVKEYRAKQGLPFE